MAIHNPDDEPKRNSRLLVLFTFAAIAFIILGVVVQLGFIELGPGDGALNIIVGLVVLAGIPFMWKKGK